jgi:hypothetical protein
MICAKAERRIDSQGITRVARVGIIQEVKMGKSNDQAHPYIPKYSAPVPNPNIPILGSLSVQS